MEAFLSELGSLLDLAGFAALGEKLKDERILKSLASAAGALWAFLKWRNLLRSSRQRLRTDLEILKLLDKDHPDYALVNERVHERIQAVYGSAPGGDASSAAVSRRRVLTRVRPSRPLIADLLWIALIAFHASWTLRYYQAESQGLFWLFPAALTAILCLMGLLSKRINALLALVFLFGFVYVTFTNINNGEYWWAMVTALLALVAMGWFTAIKDIFADYASAQPVLKWSLSAVLIAGIVVVLSQWAKMHIAEQSWWGLLTGSGALFMVLFFCGFMISELDEESLAA